MAKNIKGNHDGAKGGNDTYNIVGRGTNIPRKIIEPSEQSHFCGSVLKVERF